MRKTKLIFAVAIITILTVTISSAPFTTTANAQQATGQTNILGTCGLSFPNGNNVNYGSLVPNTISAEKKLNMTNTGTVNAFLKVKGGNWMGSGNTTVMTVDRTHFNVTSGTYFQKTTLQTFDKTITNYFTPSTILNTFWQLQTVLFTPSFTGPTTQTMNFTVICAPILFQDDYSSSSGWNQVGSTITVNSPSFPGIAKFNNAFGGGGVNDQRVYKQLPATLPANSWTVDFNYKFTASSIPAQIPLALTYTSNNPESDLTGSDSIKIYHVSTDQLRIITVRGPSGDITISQNAQYYLRLERTTTQLMLNVFSDPGRTNHILGSPVLVNILAPDYNNLNFVQHSTSLTSGAARTLTAEVDNLVIFGS